MQNPNKEKQTQMQTSAQSSFLYLAQCMSTFDVETSRAVQLFPLHDDSVNRCRNDDQIRGREANVVTDGLDDSQVYR